jgi:hypothetical protein
MLRHAKGHIPNNRTSEQAVERASRNLEAQDEAPVEEVFIQHIDVEVDTEYDVHPDTGRYVTQREVESTEPPPAYLTTSINSGNDGMARQQSTGDVCSEDSVESLCSGILMDTVTNPVENRPWEDPLLSSGPAWLLGNDFDMDEFNSSFFNFPGCTGPLLQMPIPSLGLPREEAVLTCKLLSIYTTDLTDSLLALSNTITGTIGALETTMEASRELVRKSWFTHIDNIDDIEGGAGLIARPATPVPGGARYDVNDMFRTKVAQALTSQTVKGDPLPSTKYIVSYLCALGVEFVVLILRFAYRMPASGCTSQNSAHSSL